jgi:outer membrane protein assembly factor BamD
MALGLSEFMDRAALDRLGGKLRLAASLALVAVTVAGCGTGPLLDKLTAKDEQTFSDDPADKLYNEGLFLMNKERDLKAATKKFDEVDREHP